jgi:ATP-dependent Lon protease
MPIFPLDLVLLPGAELPLHIFEPRYRKMITRCVQESIPLGVIRTQEGRLAGVGCESTVLQVLRRYPDGRFDILTRGTERFRLVSVREHADGYLEGDVEAVEEPSAPADHDLEDRLAEAYRRLASLAGDLPAEPPPRGPRWSFRLADRMKLPADARQLLLETEGENIRLRALEKHVQTILPVLLRREKAQEVVRGNGRLHGAAAPGQQDSQG